MFFCKKNPIPHDEAKMAAKPEGISIPLGGNAFITQPSADSAETITDNGLGNWINTAAIASAYFFKK